MTKAFVDSNILIYAFLDPIKGDFLDEYFTKYDRLATNRIIFGEVCYVLQKKYSYPLEKIESIQKIMFDMFEVYNMNEEIVDLANQLRKKYQFQFWDSLIFATAVHHDYNTILTEDSQHGLVVDQTTFCNPFVSGLLNN